MNTERLITKWWELEKQVDDLLYAAYLSHDFKDTYMTLAKMCRHQQKVLGGKIEALAKANPISI
jgi:hypothetical protein